MKEQIILSGTCFWSLEAVYQKINGILSIESGYYHLHNYDFKFRDEDKIESVKLEYEDGISLLEILNIFYSIHNPTMNSWIKKDCFSYYHRSSIIYETDKQKTIAEEKIKEVNKEKLFESDVTTKLIKYIADPKTFKIAPESDCNYYNKNPNDGFSKSIILPKLEKINEQFSTLYKI